MRRCAVAWAALLLGCQCQDQALHRMQDQPKGLWYEASEVFADGRVMRPPPPDTVSRQWVARGGLLPNGRAAGPDAGYVDQLPVPWSMPLLQTGRKHFDIYCAACHGLDGSGHSLASENMAIRRPPSLIAPAADGGTEGRDPTRFSLGYLYEVVADGYGVMPPFGPFLTPEERWAVAAYVRVLQRSQNASLDAVPREERQRLEGGGR